MFGLIATLCMSGCSLGYVGDKLDGLLAARQDKGDLMIAVCKSIAASGVYAEVSNPTKDEDWATFIDADGAATLDKGDVFGPLDLPEGLDATIARQPQLATGSTIAIVVQADKGSISATFDEIPTSQWVHPDGSLTNAPCGD